MVIENLFHLYINDEGSVWLMNALSFKWSNFMALNFKAM